MFENLRHFGRRYVEDEKERETLPRVGSPHEREARGEAEAYAIHSQEILAALLDHQEK